MLGRVITPTHRPLKKKSSPQPRLLDKHLFEAGLQCQKRLWLDFNEPAKVEPGALRQAMSDAGDQLRLLARSAFPKGVAIEASEGNAAAAETKQRIAEGVPVLFGATFVADGAEARCDILVVHKDAAIDVFEIKSGTKANPRYVVDLALQAHVAQASGLQLRAAYLLTVNPKYVHKEGADYPPMQLLRSADLTAKVLRHLDQVKRRLGHFRHAITDQGVLQLPMGTFCTMPFACPHLARCSKEAPAAPLRELPELTRQLEMELHKEGIEDLASLDQKREGLTFRQRRTLACVQSGTATTEPFVQTELKQCSKPLHFLALATVTEALPRFDGQRPWRQIPYGWSSHTVHADGRLETASFVHIERTDPRPGFIASLAKQLEVGGTIVCWNDTALEELSSLLEDLPASKSGVRAILGTNHLDLMQLFDAGVFHPLVRSHADLRSSVAALLGDNSGSEVTVHDEETLFDALQKATAPRVRAAKKEQFAAQITNSLTWASQRLLDLFNLHAGIEAAAPKPKADAAAAPKPKRLPKPLPKPQ